MRIAARIARLEKAFPPTPLGCDRCRYRHTTWFDGMYTRVQHHGRPALACGGCGRVLGERLKVIRGVDPGAL